VHGSPRPAHHFASPPATTARRGPRHAGPRPAAEPISPRVLTGPSRSRRPAAAPRSPGHAPTPATSRRGADPAAAPAELHRRYVAERRSLDDLGARYHVSAWTVKRWLHKAGSRRQPARWATRVTAADLRALYVQQRLTIGEIARPQARQPHHRLARAPAPPDPPAPGRPAGEPAARGAELRRLYVEAGWSLRRLAGRYQVSYTTIHQRLTRAGVPLRPRGAQGRRRSAGNAATGAPTGG